jgi:acyl-CoA dehydrogenase
MDLAFSPQQTAIRETVGRICEKFDDQYWLEHDRSGEFPREFHQTLARDGYLGILHARGVWRFGTGHQ